MAARHALEDLARLEADLVQLNANSSPGEVLKVLNMVAATIQTELPDELGLTAYVAVLHEVPPHVLHAAALELLCRHAFRTMPLPAEFLGAPAVSSWATARAWLLAMINRGRRELETRT